MLRFLARFWIIRSECDAINAIVETLRHESDDWEFVPEDYEWDRYGEFRRKESEWVYKGGIVRICFSKSEIHYKQVDSYLGSNFCSYAGTIKIKWSELGVLLDAARTAKWMKKVRKKETDRFNDEQARVAALSIIRDNAKNLILWKPPQLLPANKKVML